jgi:hypothetical protein
MLTAAEFHAIQIEARSAFIQPDERWSRMYHADVCSRATVRSVFPGRVRRMLMCSRPGLQRYLEQQLYSGSEMAGRGEVQSSERPA